MQLDRKWSIKERHRVGYRQPSGRFIQPCSVSLSLWMLCSGTALNSPKLLLSFFAPALLTVAWNSTGACSCIQPFHSLRFYPPSAQQCHSLVPSLPVEVTRVCGTFKRDTGLLMNLTATILITLPLLAETDIPCTIYSHVKEHLSQFKSSHFKSSKVSQVRVSASDWWPKLFKRRSKLSYKI